MALDQTGRRSCAYSFIGEVSANSTHEINNELAVINEQSRLTAELLAMSRMGHDVDLAELEHLMGRIIARVDQADKLVQRMNTFAHSLDREDSSCSLPDCLALMCAMFGRKAGLKEVSLEMCDTGDVAVSLGTLATEQLVWMGFDTCLEAAASGGVLKVTIRTEGEVALVAIEGDISGPPDLTFFGGWEQYGVAAEFQDRTFNLRLPRASDSDPEDV